MRNSDSALVRGSVDGEDLDAVLVVPVAIRAIVVLNLEGVLTGIVKVMVRPLAQPSGH